MDVPWPDSPHAAPAGALDVGLSFVCPAARLGARVAPSRRGVVTAASEPSRVGCRKSCLQAIACNRWRGSTAGRISDTRLR